MHFYVQYIEFFSSEGREIITVFRIVDVPYLNNVLLYKMYTLACRPLSIFIYAQQKLIKLLRLLNRHSVFIAPAQPLIFYADKVYSYMIFLFLQRMLSMYIIMFSATEQ